MPGQLLTHYFLTVGIRETPEWKASVADREAFDSFREGVVQRYEALRRWDPNEADTELHLIRPVLDLLGWEDYLPQQREGEHIPDHLLFADAASKEKARRRAKSQDVYLDALAIEESKKFGFSLDNRDGNDRVQRGTPHDQILRYLANAKRVTDRGIRWGILTNGGVWRLYDYHARSRDSGYFEADLADLLEPGNEDALRVFHLLFRRVSFVPESGSTTTFLKRALAEGKRYEEQVAQNLSGVVFERVFPRLIDAIARESGNDLGESRDAALIFLYRLLFVLYAEDRGLLPVNDVRYDDYGLRKRVRDDIARRMADEDTFSARAANYWNRLADLFRIIDEGDASIGLPPYNGGLFAPEAAPLLNTVRLSDAEIAPIIHDLSHARDAQGVRHFVNYRDMSVQQLGSIYERLLEREPVRDDEGKIVVRPNSYARKDSGSFYTPQELVDLIVERTLKPLAEEKLSAFERKAAELASDHRPRAQRQAELCKLDPAEAVLDLKVLDPAMGSGHFLVTAVDFLSTKIADLIECVPVIPKWLNGEYESPLVERVESIRSEIIRRAEESDWVLDKTQLTDQAIVRRMVLKRCIYGVDKNRLTVELAKVSLWLHSFTVGAPLSFLDHHLRCGDSLIGLRVQEAVQDIYRLGGGLFAGSAIAGAEAATTGMQRIEEMSDADIAEVRESASLFSTVEETTADLRGLLDFFCGWRWLTAGMKKKERTVFEAPLLKTLGQQSEHVYKLLAHGPERLGDDTPDSNDADWTTFSERWREARTLADREGFLHWEAAFPGVWRHWQHIHPEGGFDAIIGNPPWDRIKLQEVEWFATRAPELALAPTAAARRKGIQQLREKGSSLAAEFDAAKARSDQLGCLIRESGHYPLLGGGDINLYSLFVERALSLVKPDGFVGLLTPSGIYADKTAARFFQSVSTTGRVSGLFDFENKKIFFKDVHASFKFCALILGGEERQFERTECAFFLHDMQTIRDEDRCFPLTPDDFARVNPNTGTAPIFRTRRDADITRRIYERHPVLVDRSGGGERKVWPVDHLRQFDITNDSGLFRTAEQLNDEGFYPVEGNRWKRGEELYLPLYEGKMVQAFDHRAASVVVNLANLNRQAQPLESTLRERMDPDFLPKPGFWVSATNVSATFPQSMGWTLVYRRITAPTNARTTLVTILPWCGVSYTIPMLRSGSSEFSALEAACLQSALSSFCLDYVSRQKLQGTSMSLTSLEQLPVIAPADYDRMFGDKTARDLVRDHVLRLTYTAHDMAPFARDLGYDGPPFVWNEEERRHLRARLDALYFHLYGLDREDADVCAEHLSDQSSRRQKAIRSLPHPRLDPGLYERPGGRGYGDSGGGVGGSFGRVLYQGIPILNWNSVASGAFAVYRQ